MAEWRTWDFGEAPEPGGGRRLRRAEGAGESRGHSFIFCPSACARLRGSVAPLSLSRLRRCLPRLARGRGGARGGAGARSARLAEGGGVLALGPFLSLLRRGTATRISAAVRARGLVAAAAPHLSPHTPPRAATGPSSAPPPWGWGKGAASRRRGGEEQPHWVGGEGAGKETFHSRPPRVVPSQCCPPRVGTAPEAGARAQALTLGGRGKWWREGYVHWGCCFPSASLLPGARVRGQPATGAPIPISHQLVAGRFAASSRG